MTNGFLRPENYVDPTPRPVPLWGKRADRAYLNAVETFAPFAALVIVAQLTGKADANDGFSNRPFGVKRFQTIRHHSVDVAHGLVLLFGIGTKALVWGFFSQEVFMQSGTSFSFVGFLVRSESPFLRPHSQATP